MTIEIGIKDGQPIRASWPIYCEKKIDEKKMEIDFVSSDETVDRDHEVIRASGWKLTNYRKNPVILFAHNWSDLPIGKANKTKIENDKLLTTIQFASKEEGSDLGESVFLLVSGGFLNTLSVGFHVLESEWNGDCPDTLKPDDILRTFVKQELLEQSVVPVPANPNARAIRSVSEYDTTDLRKELSWMKSKGIMVDETYKYLTGIYDFLESRKNLYYPVKQCKHEDCQEARDKGECEYTEETNKQVEKKISGKRGLPLAERDSPWSSAVVRRRVARWASSNGSGDKDTIDWKKYGQAFVVLRAPDVPDDFGSYALPFAMVIENNLTAIPRGIFAAAAVLMGARGGIELTEADERGAKSFLKSYYERLELEPPWDRQSSYDLEQWETLELLNGVMKNDGSGPLVVELSVDEGIVSVQQQEVEKSPEQEAEVMENLSEEDDPWEAVASLLEEALGEDW